MPPPQVAQLVGRQRGPADKGTRGAWFAVLSVMKGRGMGREELQPVFEALNAKAAQQQQAPAAAGAAAGARQPQQQQLVAVGARA